MRLALLAAIPAALIWWNPPVDAEDRISALERRVEELERVWQDHDKKYHFTCELEDCMTIDDMIPAGRDPYIYHAPHPIPEEN